MKKIVLLALLLSAVGVRAQDNNIKLNPQNEVSLENDGSSLNGYFFRQVRYPQGEVLKHYDLDIYVYTVNGRNPTVLGSINGGAKYTYYQIARRIEVIEKLQKMAAADLKPQNAIVESFIGNDGWKAGYYINSGWDKENWTYNAEKERAILSELKRVMDDFIQKHGKELKTSNNFNLKAPIVSPKYVTFVSDNNNAVGSKQEAQGNNIDTPIIKSVWATSETDLIVEFYNNSQETIYIDLPDALFIDESKGAYNLLVNGGASIRHSPIPARTKRYYKFQPSSYILGDFIQPLKNTDGEIGLYIPVTINGKQVNYTYYFE